MTRLIRNRVLLILAVFVTALAVVMTSHSCRQLVAQMQDVRDTGEQLNFEHGKLRIERSTFGAPALIENMARTRLGMRPPRDSEVVVLDFSVGESDSVVIGLAQ